jgi:hypothetical protein
MALDRTALLIVARVRATMRAERAADISRLETWFAAELSDFRQELAEARVELRQARAELRRWQEIATARGVEREVDAPLN